MNSESINDIHKIRNIICIAGNDGTGKSTLFNFINNQIRKNKPQYFCIQRSFKTCPQEFKPLVQQLKQMDKVTFNYAYQDQRKNFKPSRHLTIKVKDKQEEEQQQKVNVYWFMLHLQPQKIRKRLKSRKIVDIYDSKKAVQYYSFIYRQFAWYYGIPLIYADEPTHEIVEKILRMTDNPCYELIYCLRFQQMNLDLVNQRNIQHKIQQMLYKNNQHIDKIHEMVKIDLIRSKMSQLYYLCQQFVDLFEFSQGANKQQVIKLRIKLCSRWLIKNGIIQLNQNKVIVKYFNAINEVQQILLLQGFSSQLPYLKIHEQGESKILYSIHSFVDQVQQYFKGKVIILLKSTIYSHTKQHTGQIPNLGKIRALGNIIFLQMIRRNNLKHAYECINYENGIILSSLVQTNKLQIVFKKQCLGTDKHSYHNINAQSAIVDQKNCYTSGIYVRFDWRNPNHFLIGYPNLVINLDPYYYVIEKYFGKEKFFNLFLTNQNVKPKGDKCISQDVVANYINTNKVKINTLKIYSTFLYYSRQVGLQILDGCMMFDAKGDTVWSQINPDCMRVKSIKQKQNYDKDIWRYGGSSKKQQIVHKWNIFNKLFIQWFDKNRYHQTQLLQLPQLSYPYQSIAKTILQNNKFISQQYQHYYRQIFSTRWDKKLIGTIDISQSKPILVKSSAITQSHNQSLEKAYSHISLLQDIVLVDIDAAIDKQGNGLKNNKKQIQQLINKDRSKIYAVGGGIRNQQIINYYLNTVKSNKIILSSNLDLLKLLKPQDVSNRIVVQLSINEKNQILIKGRSQNTHIHVITKILQLVDYGVKTISITFNHKQGHLNGIPRKQLVSLHSQIPQSIQNIIIAGGITSIDDLSFIWGFKRCIPQLGSAIWKNKISISDIYSSLVKFNQQGLIVAIIVDQNQKIIGQVYLNNQALRLCCQSKKLHRYSRQHQKVMKKGQTSSNVFDILNFKLDCDNDSIIIKVQPQQNKQIVFCHQNQFSCFKQNNRKNDINVLQSHILNRKQTGSGYSKRMMENQGLAAMKIIQQVQQLHISENNKIHQAADLMAHLLMYFNAHNIPMNQILSQLQRRSIETIKIQNIHLSQKNPFISDKNQNQKKMVGIISGKHFERIDKLTEGMIGVKIIRASNRSSKINYQIVNKELYHKYFGQNQISIVGIKSKDMSTIVVKNLVSSCVNYSIMMENYPIVCKQIIKQPTPGIILALLGRKNQQIDPKKWTSLKKGIIACEYPFSVNKYFKQLGVQQNCYTLIRLSGGTQSYLAAQNCNADYCDAIVQSGKTVQDNELKIVAVLQKTIYAGFYQAL